MVLACGHCLLKRSCAILAAWDIRRQAVQKTSIASDWKTSECFTTVAGHNQHEHRQLERGEKRESSEKSLPRISIIRIIAACVQVIHDEKSHATDAYLTLHIICLAE